MKETASLAGRKFSFIFGIYRLNINLFLGHTERIWCICWSYCGKYLASCGGDRTIKIWSRSDDFTEFQCICTLEDIHKRTIRAVSWSPCGNFIAACSFDASTSIYKKVSGSKIKIT